MNDWLTVVALTLLAGAAMPLGAVLASLENLRPGWIEDELRHSVIAFGGGALLSAIALVLVPEGAEGLGVGAVAFWFSFGGLAFLGLDVLLAKKHSPAGQLAAMLSDFIPEALALGAAFASGGAAGPLLAALMALQNIPEGFNAFRELTAEGGLAPRKVIGAFAAMALLGPAAGLTGFFWLAAYPAAVAALMLFAAGGILYLIFQDIAPQVKLERHWAPPLGAVAGFLLGLIGQQLTGA